MQSTARSMTSSSAISNLPTSCSIEATDCSLPILEDSHRRNRSGENLQGRSDLRPVGMRQILPDERSGGVEARRTGGGLECKPRFGERGLGGEEASGTKAEERELACASRLTIAVPPALLPRRREAYQCLPRRSIASSAHGLWGASCTNRSQCRVARSVFPISSRDRARW